MPDCAICPLPEDDSALTTILARKAVAGDQAALGELVTRFTPALVALARTRIGRHLQGLYDPLDLVGDTWVRALPRLSELQLRAGRMTPLQKHVLGKPLNVGVTDPDGTADLAHNTTAAISRLIREEDHEAIHLAIQKLEPRDREVVLLRAIEQVSNGKAAVILALEPATLSARFNRALRKLSDLLPDSLMPELSTS